MNCASWTRCFAARLCCGLCLLALAYVDAVAEQPVDFTERVTNLRWVAYSPTHSDPNRGIDPLLESLKADCSALRKAQLPHWGIFCEDRTPKLLATSLMGQSVAANSAKPSEATRSDPSLEPYTVGAFYVYFDSRSPSNHFAASGYMGDCGDIELQDDCRTGMHSGASCIKIVYRTTGKGPHTCDYPPPCKWAGLYWQKPANNWGNAKDYEGQGYDLSAYNRMVFWARSDTKCKIEFKVGGIRGPYGDNLKIARTRIVTLGKDWKEITIDLKGADLKHVIGGFGWTANWEANPKGATFYLDDIRYEK